MRGSLQQVCLRALAGLCLGLVAYGVQPKRYTAQVGLYFPGAETKAFQRLTLALRASEDEKDFANLAAADSPNFVPVAMTILRSPAAAAVALEIADPTESIGWTNADRTARFEQGLDVASPEPGIVRVQLSANSPALARSQMERLLRYYKDFISTHSFTRAKVAREQTEARLKKVVESLRRLEVVMSKSSSQELRALGDSAIKANSKVMSQVWLRRVDAAGKSNDLLRRLEKVRQSRPRAGQKLSQEWLNQWAGGKKLDPRSPRLFASLPVRPQDLQQRAKLERDYYEALLLHRSLVLQHSLLLTCEDLESGNYEMVEPLSITSKRPNFWWLTIGGALLLPLALALKGHFFSRRRPDG